MDFEILSKDKITDKLFNEFYSLLKKSFLKEEYRSFEKQKSLLEKDFYKILFCKEGNKVIGIMALWELGEFLFVEHFAVNPDFRNGGIGSKMIKFVLDKYKNNVILEVELPYNDINKRRIAFYERAGFVYNGFEYYQSPLNDGDKPLPLRIMSCPSAVCEKELEAIKSKLLKIVYIA